MTLTMTTAEWLLVLGGFLSALGVLLASMGRMLLNQFQGRLDAKFVALDEQRKLGQQTWVEMFNENGRRHEREMDLVRTDITTLSMELTRNYVRREELQDKLADLRARTQLMDEKLDRVLLAIGGKRDTP